MDAERTMQPLATALRELMADRGLTSDTDLWARAGLDSSTVSLYLAGKRGRRMNTQAIQTVEKLAKALEVPPTYFVEYRLWQMVDTLYAHLELVDVAADVINAYLSAESAALSLTDEDVARLRTITPEVWTALPIDVQHDIYRVLVERIVVNRADTEPRVRVFWR